MKPGFPFLSLASESRTVVRGLLRRPGYAVAAWIMLGLAVGANTAVFAIVYGFLLKPLPYARPQQLSVIGESLPGIGLNTSLVSIQDYLRLKKNVKEIDNAALATWPNGAPVKIGNRTHLVGYEDVTPSLFRTLGVSPLIGRLPAANADRPGGPAEVVISSHLWQYAYGGSRTVLGRMLKLNGKSYTIVGVMPPDFYFEMGGMDAWAPFVITPERARDGNINYWMVVRRKAGVSPHRLDLALKSQRDGILANLPPAKRKRAVRDGFDIVATPLRRIELDQLGIGRLPWLLQAAAALLLLLALANTINLGLVRQRARQHEFALREALGANRLRLVRLIALEHLPLVIAVGLLGLALAAAGIAGLHAFGLPPLLSPFRIVLDAPVIAFTWILTLLSVIVVTAGPAMLASGRRLLATLGHGPTDSGGKMPKRLQRALGVAQVALACALLISGGLLGVSLWRVLSQTVGFSSQHRLTATVMLPKGLSTPAAWAALGPRLSKLPGVVSSSASDMMPFSRMGSDQNDVAPLGSSGASQTTTVETPAVSASFFTTLGITFLAGRPFTAAEIAGHAPVIVVNESLARKFFGSVRNAIGKQLDMHDKPRIIGVTRNIAWQPTADQYDPGTAYRALGSNGDNLFIVIAHTHGEPAAMTHLFKRTIEQALPGSAIIRTTTLPDMMRGASVFRAAGAGMVGAFAALALFLAALGAFAITAFIARSRLGEYGIRAALGAAPGALLRFGFREAAWLLGIGLPIGLVCAWLLGQAIASALYRTPALDVGLYLAGIAVITIVVLAAAWGPARRAARTPIRNLIGGDGTQ